MYQLDISTSPYPLRAINSSHMIRDQTLIIARPIVDGIPIIWRLARAQIITILPEEIGADARRVEGCLLPRALHTAVVRGDAVFLQKAGLAGRFACRAVCADPSVAPVVGGAPFNLLLVYRGSKERWGVRTAIRIQVEGSKVNSIDTEVHGEVETLGELVRVAAVRVGVEAEALYFSLAPTIS